MAEHLRAIIPSLASNVSITNDNRLCVALPLREDKWQGLFTEFKGSRVLAQMTFPDGLGNEELIATRMHTDDEIARKVAVHVGDVLVTLSLRAVKANDVAKEKEALEQRRRVVAEIEQWGRGSGSAYQR